MTNRPNPHPTRRRDDQRRDDRQRDDGSRDDGSVLILVLVLMVLCSLIVLPIMSYAVTVLRANEVVGERGARAEAVKAGFRYAMAEPYDLYEKCGPASAGLNNGALLPTPGLDVATETKCYLLQTAAASEAAELPWSVATTYAGKAAPSGDGVVEPAYPGSGSTNAAGWIDEASTTISPATVWLPNLPVHGLNLRSGGGHAMPPGYSLNGYTECTVYFPGTYRSEVVLDGPTFFTSGIYYFERPVTVVGGADVVTGEGSFQGCTDSQYAVFYAENAPATHNVTGLGATFVFGGEGRLIVDDTAGPIRFRMNQRYVAPEDTGTAPSAKVSIMTVNGDLDDALETTNFAGSGIDLVLPAGPEVPELVVPLSQVDSVSPRPAPVDQYRPSTLTPARREPTAPLAVTGTTYDGAMVVSWDPPENDGGAPITQYAVTSSPDNRTCVTTGALTCVVEGLANGTDYTFQVVATNVEGDSEPSEPSASLRPTSSRPTLTVPAAPTGVGVEEALTLPLVNVSRYVNAFVFEWEPGTAAEAAPTREYEVTITDTATSETHTCTSTDATTCTITGLPPAQPIAIPPYLAQYDVSIVARNVVGASPAATLTGISLPLVGDTYVEPVAEPHPPYVPPAVIDIDLTTGNDVELIVPGYVSVPQGVIDVSTAPEHAGVKTVELGGGVLSAWTELSDIRPGSFKFGIVNPQTQRIIKIVTTAIGSNTKSEAIVQVNESGGWAVNSWVVQ